MITLPDLDIVRNWQLPARAADPDGSDALGVMEVRFSQYGTWYEIDSWYEGRFLERTQKGAFAKTIRESSDRVKVLFNHGHDFSIGDKILGSIDSLREESDSPVGVVPLFDTSYNRDLLPGLRAGVYGSSFIFRVVKDSWDKEPGASEHNPEGIPERTLTEVRLFEFGPVTWPANPDATAGLRCASGTDGYYEQLRSRDPKRVDELRSRVSALRTSSSTPAAAGTGPTEAAPSPTDAPDTASAVHHSTGLSASARSRILALPFLFRETDREPSRAPVGG